MRIFVIDEPDDAKAELFMLFDLSRKGLTPRARPNDQYVARVEAPIAKDSEERAKSRSACEADPELQRKEKRQVCTTDIGQSEPEEDCEYERGHDDRRPPEIDGVSAYRPTRTDPIHTDKTEHTDPSDGIQNQECCGITDDALPV